MKLIFFLVAFFLVIIRFYFSWSGKENERNGISESNMVIRSDNFNQEIKYAGRFVLTDDESGFKSISPGGHLKFIRNEEIVKAESNLQGNIEYRIFDGKNQLSPQDEKGKKLISETVHQMIYWGFDAEARLERVYLKGGADALLKEVDSMRLDQTKALYLSRLFKVDSLSPEYMPLITRKIAALGSDRDKANFLEKISSARLKNPLIAEAYFSVLDSMGSDMDRAGAIQHLVDENNLSDSNMLRLIAATGILGSDMNKKNIFSGMIGKAQANSVWYDSLLIQISQIGSDFDKFNLYTKMVTEKKLTETQWIPLINDAAVLGSDFDKTNLLILIAGKIPKTRLLRETYLRAAKSVVDDNNYGRVIRAID